MSSSNAAGSAATDQDVGDLPRPLGRYVLLRRIARGGMGEVFLASTTGLEGAERPVVVKVIRREHSKDPSFIARFLDEARVQAQLQHSGVAQVLDAAVDPHSGDPYVVVEHVEGRSLGDLRSRASQTGTRLSWEDAVSIATMIAEALAHVHERLDPSGRALAIVHRDLSPQNVMLSYSGEIKIIDFGTARGQNRRCHTVQGVVFAKPGYVAPEVANGDSGDARVDLYALGIMLWEMVKGTRFLQGDANVHLAMVSRNAMAPPKIAAAAGAPEELDDIIAKLTAFDRDARYSSGRAAARDMARVLGAAKPLSNGERGIRARATELMSSLFPGEPAKARRDFARLVAAARENRDAMPTPVKKMDPPPESKPKDVKASQSSSREEDKSLLDGTRYRLRREIGRGSSGVVFEAEHVDLGRRVAVKILGAEQSRSKEFAARFRREARALSKLDHVALVEVLDFGLTGDGRLFCVMELLEGETLEAYLSRERGVDWREALGVAKRVLRGLEVAHEASLVHRDIKPANLFMTKDGGIKILDFGLAKTADEADPNERGEGQGGGASIYGTPEYMAPEQASAGEVDARADLYSLGCVLYEMLSGRLPFVGTSAAAILEAKIKGSPEKIRERAPSRNVPSYADDLVMRAMARHPSIRFQSAGEMLAAIDVALERPSRQKAGRRKLGYALVAAAMAFSAVVLAGKSPRVRAAVPWLRPTSMLSVDTLWTRAAGVVVATPVEEEKSGNAVSEPPVANLAPAAPVVTAAPEQSAPPPAHKPVAARPRPKHEKVQEAPKAAAPVEETKAEPDDAVADERGLKKPSLPLPKAEKTAKTSKKHKKKTRLASKSQ